jgi:hypothetical protein
MPGLAAAIQHAFIALFLALQVAGATGWTTIDASRLDLSAEPHVERAGGNDCAPPHDEAQCRLCQATSVRLPPDPAPFAPVADSRLPAARRVTEPHRLFSSFTSGNPRAPPAPLG